MSNKVTNAEVQRTIKQLESKSKKGKTAKPVIKVSKDRRDKHTIKILDFAVENNLVINPRIGYSYLADGYLMFNHCPCDSKRPTCPCSEALEECRGNGHCKCTLFWRDYATFKGKSIMKEE